MSRSKIVLLVFIFFINSIIYSQTIPIVLVPIGWDVQEQESFDFVPLDFFSNMLPDTDTSSIYSPESVRITEDNCSLKYVLFFESYRIEIPQKPGLDILIGSFDEGEYIGSITSEIRENALFLVYPPGSSESLIEGATDSQEDLVAVRSSHNSCDVISPIDSLLKIVPPLPTFLEDEDLEPSNAAFLVSEKIDLFIYGFVPEIETGTTLTQGEVVGTTDKQVNNGMVVLSLVSEKSAFPLPIKVYHR